MRADRLLSMMMLLQSRGRMTAQELAGALEVSVRTVYRDLEALDMAGVPVYTESGPGGGCGLFDDYRTTLTGMRDDEVRALFMLSVPSALHDLGFGDELKAALLKLSAALPARRRNDETWVRQRIHLDWTEWAPVPERAPHLRVIQRAVWEDHKLTLNYWLEGGAYRAQLERLVEPYGLVAKTGVWHLVYAADGSLHVHNVADLAYAQIHPERFERPADFDLASFWQAWCVETAKHRRQYPVTIRISPQAAIELPYKLGGDIRQQLATAEAPDIQGWRTLTLVFDSLYDARYQLLGFGAAVEVLAPEPLRLSLLDFAQQIVQHYTT